ncbi:quinolinate synthase NadA [Fusobacterium sp.]|uniref:quinolinate synthase NadA n=1 Tax=Fusobacterium sp. TaxID=68766 RepID=UPI0025C3CF18|nr:quinolinate synthase NadA [Fusobacterium sp.]
MKNEINNLKKEKNAVILAHYYTRNEVQEIADYIGDSYYLSEKAQELKEDIIIMCGVYFMGESVKLLNPNKKILIPDTSSDCPMAHMVTLKQIDEMRKKYDDLAVVCYVNSTAEIKSKSDICVTSANAVKIVEKLENRNIYFIPDKHLGSYVATKVKDKNIILNDGYCPIHHTLLKKDVELLKEKYPQAKILVHPECRKEVVQLGDFVGSTSGIINYVNKSEDNEFIICTELGILYELESGNPNKKFYYPEPKMECLDMKKITLENIHKTLCNEDNEIIIESNIQLEAIKPLKKMLQLGR